MKIFTLIICLYSFSIVHSALLSISSENLKQLDFNELWIRVKRRTSSSSRGMSSSRSSSTSSSRSSSSSSKPSSTSSSKSTSHSSSSSSSSWKPSSSSNSKSSASSKSSWSLSNLFKSKPSDSSSSSSTVKNDRSRGNSASRNLLANSNSKVKTGGSSSLPSSHNSPSSSSNIFNHRPTTINSNPSNFGISWPQQNSQSNGPFNNNNFGSTSFSSNNNFGSTSFSNDGFQSGSFQNGESKSGGFGKKIIGVAKKVPPSVYKSIAKKIFEMGKRMFRGTPKTSATAFGAGAVTGAASNRINWDSMQNDTLRRMFPDVDFNADGIPMFNSTDVIDMSNDTLTADNTTATDVNMTEVLLRAMDNSERFVNSMLANMKARVDNGTMSQESYDMFSSILIDANKKVYADLGLSFPMNADGNANNSSSTASVVSQSTVLTTNTTSIPDDELIPRNSKLRSNTEVQLDDGMIECQNCG